MAGAPGRGGDDEPGPVDYDRVAARYHRGRALSDATLDAWWTAAAPFVPTRRPLTVLDLGAGTGIFARAWSRWCECRVVAVEPSSGMRAGALAVGPLPGAAMMAGVGETLPLRGGCVDVAWLSTVVHHLRDRAACFAELRRVVAPGGAVLVRGFFSDRGAVGWLGFFPGADAARGRFPDSNETAAVFAVHGFDAAAAMEVDAGERETVAGAARWARRMREADTLLSGFTAEEFDAGLAALDGAEQDRVLTSQLTLLAFTRR